MALATIALFALGTAGAISVPIIAREIVKYEQTRPALTAERPKPLGISQAEWDAMPASQKSFEALGTSPLGGHRTGDERALLRKAYADPKVQQAMREADAIVTRQVETEGLASGIIYNVPGARAFRGTTYESALTGKLQQKGYTYEDARIIARGGQELWRAESAGEATGAVAASAFAEAGGAALAGSGLKGATFTTTKAAAKGVGKQVFKSAFIAGTYEGAVTTATAEAAPTFYGRRELGVGTAARVGFGGVVGGFTAGVLGGGIAYASVRSPTVGKAALYGAYAIDPYEPVGDILAGTGKGGVKSISKALHLPTFGKPSAAVQAFKGVTVQVGKKAVKAPLVKGAAVPAVSVTNLFAPSVATAPTPTASATPSLVPTFVPTPTDLPTFTPTPTPTTTTTTTTTTTPTTTTTTVSNIFMPTTTTAETPTETPTEVTTTTPTPTPTPTPTTTPVPVATPLPRLTPPFLPPIGSGGTGVARRGQLSYIDEFRAAQSTFRGLL